jgi:hypothetical protein
MSQNNKNQSNQNKRNKRNKRNGQRNQRNKDKEQSNKKIPMMYQFKNRKMLVQWSSNMKSME